MDLNHAEEIITNLSETTKNQSALIKELNNKIYSLESTIKDKNREVTMWKGKLEDCIYKMEDYKHKTEELEDKLKNKEI